MYLCSTLFPLSTSLITLIITIKIAPVISGSFSSKSADIGYLSGGIVVRNSRISPISS